LEVKFRAVREGDIEALLADMRPCDHDEVLAASGDVERALVDSVQMSETLNVMEIDGELACMFGLVALPTVSPQTAAPWMLGTRLIDRHPSVLVRHSLGYVEAMQARYPHLMNYVDARNTRSIRWLKRLGFQFHEAEPYGVAGLPFHLFQRSAPHV
jgi:hypothetical protein